MMLFLQRKALVDSLLHGLQQSVDRSSRDAGLHQPYVRLQSSCAALAVVSLSTRACCNVW
jgi:hypothetical protein